MALYQYTNNNRHFGQKEIYEVAAFIQIANE